MNCKRFWVLVYPLIGFAESQRSLAQTEPGPDAKCSLDGTWQFAFAPHEADAEALSGFYQEGFSSKTFRPTPVPSNWAMQGYEDPVYKPFKTEAGEGFLCSHVHSACFMEREATALAFRRSVVVGRCMD